jgi:hypothetical protein
MTMRCYDLYGSKTRGIENLVGDLDRVLGVRLERHESGYIGGDYFLAGDLRSEHFVLQRHEAGDDETELPEPAFSEYSILLQVNNTSRGDELRSLLARVSGLVFLRRSYV